MHEYGRHTVRPSITK